MLKIRSIAVKISLIKDKAIKTCLMQSCIVRDKTWTTLRWLRRIKPFSSRQIQPRLTLGCMPCTVRHRQSMHLWLMKWQINSNNLMPRQKSNLECTMQISISMQTRIKAKPFTNQSQRKCRGTITKSRILVESAHPQR